MDPNFTSYGLMSFDLDSNSDCFNVLWNKPGTYFNESVQKNPLVNNNAITVHNIQFNDKLGAILFASYVPSFSESSKQKFQVIFVDQKTGEILYKEEGLTKHSASKPALLNEKWYGLHIGDDYVFINLANWEVRRISVLEDCGYLADLEGDFAFLSRKNGSKVGVLDITKESVTNEITMVPKFCQYVVSKKNTLVSYSDKGFLHLFDSVGFEHSFQLVQNNWSRRVFIFNLCVYVRGVDTSLKIVECKKSGKFLSISFTIMNHIPLPSEDNPDPIVRLSTRDIFSDMFVIRFDDDGPESFIADVLNVQQYLKI